MFVLMQNLEVFEADQSLTRLMNSLINLIAESECCDGVIVLKHTFIFRYSYSDKLHDAGTVDVCVFTC